MNGVGCEASVLRNDVTLPGGSLSSASLWVAAGREKETSGKVMDTARTPRTDCTVSTAQFFTRDASTESRQSSCHSHGSITTQRQGHNPLKPRAESLCAGSACSQWPQRGYSHSGTEDEHYGAGFPSTACPLDSVSRFVEESVPDPNPKRCQHTQQYKSAHILIPETANVNLFTFNANSDDHVPLHGNTENRAVPREPILKEKLLVYDTDVCGHDTPQGPYMVDRCGLNAHNPDDRSATCERHISDGQRSYEMQRRARTAQSERPRLNIRQSQEAHLNRQIVHQMNSVSWQHKHGTVLTSVDEVRDHPTNDVIMTEDSVSDTYAPQIQHSSDEQICLPTLSTQHVLEVRPGQIAVSEPQPNSMPPLRELCVQNRLADCKSLQRKRYDDPHNNSSCGRVDRGASVANTVASSSHLSGSGHLIENAQEWSMLPFVRSCKSGFHEKQPRSNPEVIPTGSSAMCPQYSRNGAAFGGPHASDMFSMHDQGFTGIRALHGQSQLGKDILLGLDPRSTSPASASLLEDELSLHGSHARSVMLLSASVDKPIQDAKAIPALSGKHPNSGPFLLGPSQSNRPMLGRSGDMDKAFLPRPFPRNRHAIPVLQGPFTSDRPVLHGPSNSDRPGLAVLQGSFASDRPVLHGPSNSDRPGLPVLQSPFASDRPVLPVLHDPFASDRPVLHGPSNSDRPGLPVLQSPFASDRPVLPVLHDPFASDRPVLHGPSTSDRPILQVSNPNDRPDFTVPNSSDRFVLARAHLTDGSVVSGPNPSDSCVMNRTNPKNGPHFSGQNTCDRLAFNSPAPCDLVLNGPNPNGLSLHDTTTLDESNFSYKTAQCESDLNANPLLPVPHSAAKPVLNVSVKPGLPGSDPIGRCLSHISDPGAGTVHQRHTVTTGVPLYELLSLKKPVCIAGQLRNKPTVGPLQAGDEPTVGLLQAGDKPTVGLLQAGDEPTVGLLQAGDEPAVGQHQDRDKSGDCDPTVSWIPSLAEPFPSAIPFLCSICFNNYRTVEELDRHRLMRHDDIYNPVDRACSHQCSNVSAAAPGQMPAINVCVDCSSCFPSKPSLIAHKCVQQRRASVRGSSDEVYGKKLPLTLAPRKTILHIPLQGSEEDGADSQSDQRFRDDSNYVPGKVSGKKRKGTTVTMQKVQKKQISCSDGEVPSTSNNTRRYKCPDCGAAFCCCRKQSINRWRHVDEWPYMCPECGDSFLKVRSLQRHRCDL